MDMLCGLLSEITSDVTICLILLRNDIQQVGDRGVSGVGVRGVVGVTKPNSSHCMPQKLSYSISE